MDMGYEEDKQAYEAQMEAEKRKHIEGLKRTLKTMLGVVGHGTNRSNQEGLQDSGATQGASNDALRAAARALGAQLAAAELAKALGPGGSLAMAKNLTPGNWNPLGQNPLTPGFISPLSAQPYMPTGLPPGLQVGGNVGGPLAPPPQPLRAGWMGEVAERDKPIEGWREYHLLFSNSPAFGKEVKLEGAGRRFVMEGRKAKALCESTSTNLDQVRKLLNDEALFNLWASRQFGEGGLAAICRRHLEEDPEGCGCGFYGRNKECTDYGAVVHARVSAYGVVVCDDKGNWRASELQLEEVLLFPQLLHAPGLDGLEQWLDWPSITDLLRDRYAVPVKVVTR